MIIKVRKSFLLIFPAVATAFTVFLIMVQSVSVLSSLDGVKLPVVMYHQLTKSGSKAGKYVLTVEQFENDLKFLKENGYETVTVNQLLAFSKGDGGLPEKPVMITFDDGCETLYAYALPLLEEYGFSAVGFAVGAWTDSYTESDDHNLNYSCLNWAEIKEMCDGGVVDIQSHSFDLHKNTAERSGAQKKKGESFEEYYEFLCSDAVKMKERMVDSIGKAPIAFAYPFGSYSSESAEILNKVGIEIAFTCEERVNIIKKAEPEQLFRLGRYNRPNGISSENFFKKWE